MRARCSSPCALVVLEDNINTSSTFVLLNTFVLVVPKNNQLCYFYAQASYAKMVGTYGSVMGVSVCPGYVDLIFNPL